MHFMVFVAASDFNHSSNRYFPKWPQFGEGQSRTVLPSTPVPGHVSGGPSCLQLMLAPAWGCGQHVLGDSVLRHHKHRKSLSRPAPSCTLPGQEVGWVPFMSLVPMVVPGHSVKSCMVTWAHWSPYLETPTASSYAERKGGQRWGQRKIKKLVDLQWLQTMIQLLLEIIWVSRMSAYSSGQIWDFTYMRIVTCYTVYIKL